MSRFFRRKRYCRFTAEGITEIDYKDLTLLKAYVGESGKVVPRYAAHLDFRKAQVLDPGRRDDRQADHYGVADQRHVDADSE